MTYPHLSTDRGEPSVAALVQQYGDLRTQGAIEMATGDPMKADRIAESAAEVFDEIRQAVDRLNVGWEQDRTELANLREEARRWVPGYAGYGSGQVNTR
jgi:hypothetical protein